MAPRETSVTLVRRIRATPDKVYDAWTQPEQMACWWSPDAGPVLLAEADVRPGGHYRVMFEMMTGERRECSGVYQRIEPDRLLVFTWQWHDEPDRRSLVKVEMRAVAEGTELVLTHARLQTELALATHGAGWTVALDKLAAHAERGVRARAAAFPGIRSAG